KTARLLPVAVDSEPLTAQRLLDHSRDDHAVLSGLSCAHRVEQTEDDHRKACLVVVGQPEELVQRFGTGIAPARLARWPDDQVVVLTESSAAALAVDL